MISAPAFDLRSKHTMPTATESSNTHDAISSTTPVAMRSSFAVGVRWALYLAVVTYNYIVLFIGQV